MKVVIISGPTATGKTDLSIEMARKFGGEIVNFDSLLLYQEITIGTAKPTKEEQGEIPHHLIDVASISSPLNAADYARVALPKIQELLLQKKLVYLVGGSGFYLQALLKGMYDSPTSPPSVTEKSNQLYQQEGIVPFLKILKDTDPLSYSRYHENDHYRIRRAVEHFWATQIPLSEARAKKDQENLNLNASNIHGWEVLHLYLNIPKDEHLEIIKRRTDRMLKAGLIEEVQNLLAQGYTGLERPLQSIGYKEVIDFLQGRLPDQKTYLERIIISTCQLAKAQRTWFNRIKEKQTFHPVKEKKEIAHQVEQFSKE